MGNLLNIKENFDAAVYRPSGWREGYFTNSFDNQLRYGFAPAQGNAKKGTIVLTHGYGEFIELYYQAIQEYQKMGFDVWAMDFYGFGKSGRDDPKNPHRPSTKGLLRHVRDLDFFVQNIVQKVPNKPLVMSTNSMGGHIGLLYLQKHKDVFDAAIMSSPMLDVYRLGLPLFARPLIRMVFNFASAIGLRDTSVPENPAFLAKISGMGSSFKNNPNNSLREHFNNMMRIALPETKVERPTFGWIAQAFNTIVKSTTDEALSSVKVPILLGSAGLDTLVDNRMIAHAAQLMPRATLLEMPTAHHGLWFENDKNYNTWISTVRSFIHKISGKALHAEPSATPQRNNTPPSPENRGNTANLSQSPDQKPGQKPQCLNGVCI